MAIRNADNAAIRSSITIAALLILCAPLAQVGAASADDADPFAPPAALEPDVRFWIRVYTEVTTDQGLLHDSWNLGVVYEVLRFDPDTPPAVRERRVAAAKTRYADLLRRFARGDTENLTAHERRILHAFGENPTRADFTDAIDRMRFQLGQADRFQEGLIRAAQWERHIARTLRENGVPEEIAALPHVESSFNPAAYSRVGAAGLWQFMPSTARRYMRVDGLVDERLDPYRATEAAANLMLYNYRLVGTWPLAVTAYNHGPGGLRRAQDDLGTSDIAVIVKRYQGATFGFASRNFYVAFLAALEVDRNAEKFFGPRPRLPDAESFTIELPDYLPVDALGKAFRVDMGALRVLNPALLPPIWNGSRFVPRGYALRLPGFENKDAVAAALDALPLAQRYLGQRNDASHRLHRGETLALVAERSGVSLPRLLAANGWAVLPKLERGQTIRIPLPPTRADKAPAVLVASTDMAVVPTPVEAPPPPGATDHGSPRPREPVSERQAETTALLPAATPASNSDATDYSVGMGNTIIVSADETLGHLAEWAETSPDALRTLNRVNKRALVGMGRKLKIDLRHVDAEQFTAARRAYHRRLQDAYFQTHRIASTEIYAVRRGESIWIISQQHGDLPVWLVSQYNPDVNFGGMRPGTSLTLPKVETINRR